MGIPTPPWWCGSWLHQRDGLPGPGIDAFEEEMAEAVKGPAPVIGSSSPPRRTISHSRRTDAAVRGGGGGAQHVGPMPRDMAWR